MIDSQVGFLFFFWCGVKMNQFLGRYLLQIFFPHFVLTQRTIGYCSETTLQKTKDHFLWVRREQLLKGALWNFLVNYLLLTFTITHHDPLCISWSSNKHVDCMSLICFTIEIYIVYINFTYIVQVHCYISWHITSTFTLVEQLAEMCVVLPACFQECICALVLVYENKK